ncbi:MAG: hypothetical protein ACJARD_001214 [Alphaproteobacteria bacterium]|jgi:hypothetical protein
MKIMVAICLKLCFNKTLLIFLKSMLILMKHSKIFLLIASLFILASCTIPTRQNFDTQMTSYQGKSVDNLVKVWGAPRASYVNSDNSRVYQWTQGGSSTHFQGASYPWIGAQSHAYAPWNHALFPAWGGGLLNGGVGMFVARPMTLDRSCTLNISADAKNIVTAHNAIGSGCVAE